jgi:hypothetical protein
VRGRIILNKRERILKMIREAHTNENGTKTISYSDFERYDLHPLYEVGDRYNDVIYAMRVANKIGYRTRVGGALHLYPKVQSVSNQSFFSKWEKIIKDMPL